MKPSKDKTIFETGVIVNFFSFNKIKQLKIRQVKLKIRSPQGSLPPKAKGVNKVKKIKTK